MSFCFNLKTTFNYRIRVYASCLLYLLVMYFIYNRINYKNAGTNAKSPVFKREIERRLLTRRADGTICLKNRGEYLQSVRMTQRQLVDEWHKMNISNRAKWNLIGGLYEASKILVKLLGRFKSDGETKYYFKFIDQYGPCNVITFGVGMDYSGETQFWNKYPQCKMTAVDPVSEINKEMVEKVPNARFFQAVVGASNLTHTARIKQKNLAYETFATNYSGIVPFIQKINGNQLIDLMLVDIEGDELGMFEIFVEQKHKLPTICQMNLEIHYASNHEVYKLNDTINGIYKFLADETYTIFNVEVWKQHWRIFLVNTANQECIDKLLC